MDNLTFYFTFPAVIILSFFALKQHIIFFHKKGLLDNPEGRKQHKIPTPTAGGIIFIIPMLAFYITNPNPTNLIVLLIFLGFSILGLVDDLKNLSAIFKFGLQIAFSTLIIYLNGPYEFIAEITQQSSALNDVLSVVFMVGIINSVNLIDGSDGLAGLYGSTFFIVSIGASLFVGSSELAVMATLLLGSLLVFLYFNFEPAKVFMGDTGSLTMGFSLAYITLRLVNESGTSYPTINYALVPLLLLPAMDTFRVMMWRIINKTSPFKADRTHLHHILSIAGLNAKKISFTFSTIGIIILSFSLLTYHWEMSLLKSLMMSTSLTIAAITIAIRKMQIRRHQKMHSQQEKLNKTLLSNHLLKKRIKNENA